MTANLLTAHTCAAPAGARPRRLARALAAAALALALGASMAACGTLKSKGEQLHASVFAYNNAVRWQRFHLAAKSIDTERREAWVASMERAARAFVVVDYETTPVEIDDDKAIIDVSISYYRRPGVVVEHEQRRQIWRYRGDTWMLDAERQRELAEERPPDRLPELVGPDDA